MYLLFGACERKTMSNMAADVRIFTCVVATTIVILLQSCGTGAQGFGELFGALGGLMGEMGAGDLCEFECSNGRCELDEESMYERL